MFRYLTILIISVSLTLLIFSSVLSKDSRGLDRNTTSTIKTHYDKDGNIVVNTVSRRFTFTEYLTENVFVPEQYRTLLLLEEFNSERNLRMEGEQSKVKVEAWIGKDANPTDKLWTIEQEGSEGSRYNRFYKITNRGCCGAEDTYLYFNFQSGQKIFTSNIELSEIEVPNTHVSLVRYAGFHSREASIAPAESGKYKDIVGIFQYGSESKVLGRLLLRTSLNETLGSPKIKFLYQKKLTETSPLMLWGADKKNDKSSLSDFSIILSYDTLQDIIIPVANDTLDIGRATIPKSFSLESL
jgi:hypothetical protein